LEEPTPAPPQRLHPTAKPAQEQVNGVVQTLVSVGQALERMGVEVSFLTPEGIPSIPLPSYPDIRLALPSSRAIARARIFEAIPPVVYI